jgi:hypothetical protein
MAQFENDILWSSVGMQIGEVNVSLCALNAIAYADVLWQRQSLCI